MSPEVHLQRARRLGWSPATYLLPSAHAAGVARVARQPLEEGGTGGAEDGEETLAPEEVGDETALDFPFDADEDGEDETKRAYVRPRADGLGYEAVVNPDPIPLKEFVDRQVKSKKAKIAPDAQLATWVGEVEDELKSSTITENKGGRLRQLFLRIVQRLFVLRNALKGGRDTGLRPRTVIQQHSTAQIQDPKSGVTETVPQLLDVDPLSIVPPQSPTWTGYGVKNPNTNYMVALKKEGNYVRGHMLNAKLHGPGIDDNLVPISQELNSAMRTEYEDDLKRLINKDLQVVKYTVTPDFGTAPLDPGGRPYVQPDLFAKLPGRIGVRIDEYAYKKNAGDKADISNWSVARTLFNKMIPHVLSFTPRKQSSKINDKTPVTMLSGPTLCAFTGDIVKLKAGDVAKLNQPGFGLVGGHRYTKSVVGSTAVKPRTVAKADSAVYSADSAYADVQVQGNTLVIVPKDVGNDWIKFAAERGKDKPLRNALDRAEGSVEKLRKVLSGWVSVKLDALPTLEETAKQDSDLGRRVAVELPGIVRAAAALEERAQPFLELMAALNADIQRIGEFQVYLETIELDVSPKSPVEEVFRSMLDVAAKTEEVEEAMSEIAQLAGKLDLAFSNRRDLVTGKTWIERNEALEAAYGSPEVLAILQLFKEALPTG